MKFRDRKQTRFSGRAFGDTHTFGGELAKRSKFRGARPFSTKCSMHMTLKSSQAKGAYSFGHKNNPQAIKVLIDKHCSKYAVKLISYSNNFNHLHLHLKFASRALYLKFVRTITAAIAMTVTGAAKSRGLTSLISAKKYFDYRPFTRLVFSRRAYQVLEDYIQLNRLEADGTLPKRNGRLREVETSERHLFKKPRCDSQPRSENPQMSWL